LDKIIIILFTVGLFIVGGLATYSIYLQQDESRNTVKGVYPQQGEFNVVKEITTYEKNCLERWDYLRLVNKETSDYKLIADTQHLNMEFFITTDCADSFRDWMPENHEDWDDFVYFENNKKSICESYLKGEPGLHEWMKPVMREMGCEEIIKQ